MGEPTPGNPNPDPKTGDLWKKVLEEVQTEAAARRSKAVARLASAPQKSGIELDLLKRILVAIETKPVAPTDHTALLEQILTATQRHPSLNPQDIIEPITKALAAADPTPAIEKVASTIEKVTSELRQELRTELRSEIRSDVRSDLREEITTSLAAIPQPADLSPQLDAIVQSLKNQPTLDPAAIIAPITQAIEEHRQQDTSAQSFSALHEQVEKLSQSLAAMPQPTDVAPQLQAILTALQSQPSSPAFDPDALATRIVEAIEKAKPADISHAIAELDAKLESKIDALPRPVDASEKLAEILAAIQHRADDGRDVVLLQILDAVKQPRESVDAQKLDAISRQIEAWMQATPDAASSTKEAVEALRQQMQADLAALPKPVDLSPQLESILTAIQAQPRVDVDAAIARAVEATKAASPQPASDTQTADAAAQAMQAQAQLLEQLRDQLAALTQAQQQFAAQIKPADTDNAQVIRTQLHEELVAQQASLHEGLAALRNELQQQLTQQTSAVREDMLAHSIELIDQLKAHSPLAMEQSLRELRDEVKTAAPPAKDDGALDARLLEVLQAVRSVPQPAVQQNLDMAALVEQLRGAMPAPAAPIDAHALAEQVTQRVVEQVKAAIPAPAASFDPTSLPRHEADFAKQEQLLLALQTKLDHAVNQDAAAESIKQLHDELQTIRLQNLTAQQNFDRTLHTLTGKLETKVESKINAGFAKLELAMATGDQGRPHDVFADDTSSPPAARYSYSWMNQSSRQSRGPMVAMSIIATAAVGMFLVLLISALSDNGNTSNIDPGSNPIANKTPANNDKKIAANSDNSKTTPAAIDTKTTDPKSPDTTSDKGPYAIFPPVSSKDAGGANIAKPIITELHNLTNPGSSTRVVYELTQAKQVVFLVHINGNSAAALATSMAELKKTMAQLRSPQKFTVIFSQGRTFTETPPHGLREASAASRNSAETWMDVNIRSSADRVAANPLVALDVAMSYAPDLLWIISDGLSGQGEGQVSSKEILDRIATLNADGSIRIAATQVGTADTGDTLKALAEKYGGAYIVAGGGSSASLLP